MKRIGIANYYPVWYGLFSVRIVKNEPKPVRDAIRIFVAWFYIWIFID